MSKEQFTYWPAIRALCFLCASLFVAEPAFAQNKVIGAYTFPDIPIKEFQNQKFPGSIINDHKVLLGSVGSDPPGTAAPTRVTSSGC